MITMEKTVRTFALMLVFLVTGCAASFADAPQSVQRRQAALLQEDMNAFTANGSVGAFTEVISRGTPIYARAGVATIGTQQPIDPAARFRIGSVTKVFVATVVLQLVGEGRLSLDDTVDHWLPGVVTGNGNDGTRITVRELLQHTSGLFDYTEDATFTPLYRTAKGFASLQYQTFTPRQLISLAISHPPYFAPGTGYHYSSTGYVTAGQIIQAVTGNTWQTEVQNRIITPLALTGTNTPDANPALPSPYANGYAIYSSNSSHRIYTETTLDNMTWADAAGSLISTTSDVDTFMSALLRAQILSPAMLAVMKQDVPVAPNTGLGIGRGTSTCSDGTVREYWGHSGKVIGYASIAFATTDGNIAATVADTTMSTTETQFINGDNTVQGSWLTHAACS